MSSVVLTGGAGFVGGAVARLLMGRGDRVVALVRDPSRPGSLAGLDVELVGNDLASADAIARAAAGADGLIHAAGSYRIGIRASERAAMMDANVGVTERVLDGAARAGVARIVVVSTVNVFGNTKGRVVDETFRRDLADGFLSTYDESKHRSHELAEARIAGGAPIIIVQPSQVYGPGDHSDVGRQLADAASGRLRYTALRSLGLGMVHVEDLADGIVAALDRGRVGESYVLSGPRTRLGEALEAAAAVGHRGVPRLTMPTALLRLVARLPERVAVAAGSAPNLSEVLSASDGVTYWATAAKAERELGFRTRSLAEGFAQVYGPGSTGDRPA